MCRVLAFYHFGGLTCNKGFVPLDNWKLSMQYDNGKYKNTKEINSASSNWHLPK